MPDRASAFKSIRLFDLTIDYFDGGKHWTQGQFHDRNDGRCLVYAMQRMRAVHKIKGDRARQYLLEAMPQNWRSAGLMQCNDRCAEFSELLMILCRAKDMALSDAYGLPKPEPVIDPLIIAVQDALRQRHVAAARRETYAQLARDRTAPDARWITRDTYILCPRPPEPMREPAPERLAA